MKSVNGVGGIEKCKVIVVGVTHIVLCKDRCDSKMRMAIDADTV